MLNLRIIHICFLFALWGEANTISPQEYFGDSYSEALRFCQHNRLELLKVCTLYKVDPSLALSVVFPEIIRYNRFRDFAETAILEIAYIQSGKSYADFSIGRFQMKPSFVETLENELREYPTLYNEFFEVSSYPNDFNEVSVRRERIARLKQTQWQLIYLACFIRLAQERFAQHISENQDEELLIISYAYNAGLKTSFSRIKQLSSDCLTPYSKLSYGRFSYYDVSSFFYKNHVNRVLGVDLKKL